MLVAVKIKVLVAHKPHRWSGCGDFGDGLHYHRSAQYSAYRRKQTLLGK
jgi:hypothetical protein